MGSVPTIRACPVVPQGQPGRVGLIQDSRSFCWEQLGTACVSTPHPSARGTAAHGSRLEAPSSACQGVGKVSGTGTVTQLTRRRNPDFSTPRSQRGKSLAMSSLEESGPAVAWRHPELLTDAAREKRQRGSESFARFCGSEAAVTWKSWEVSRGEKRVRFIGDCSLGLKRQHLTGHPAVPAAPAAALGSHLALHCARFGHTRPSRRGTFSSFAATGARDQPTGDWGGGGL